MVVTLCQRVRMMLLLCMLAALHMESSGATRTVPQATLIDEERRYVPITDCAVRELCTLRGVGFRIARYELPETKSESVEIEYGTVIYAWYDTTDIPALQDYVFVQFLRGCYIQTNTYRGETTRHFLPLLHHDVTGPYCFPEWVIDRDHEDPAYSSEPLMSRHFFAQWFDGDPEVFPTPEKTKYYGMEMPTIPRLGMLDRPYGAFVRKWGNGRILANSAHLEFRTCLYRTTDVPLNFDEQKDRLPPPIVCHEWNSIYGYDPSTQSITRGTAIGPICISPDIAKSPEALRPPRMHPEKK